MSNTTKKEKVMAILKGLDTKKNLKNTGIETAKALAVAFGGACAGAAIGKPSLLAGLLPTALGYYYDSKPLTVFGVAMMAAGGDKVSGINGTTNGVNGVKENLKAVAEDFKSRLYLDKIIKKKTVSGTNGTNGLGEVQYFKYPQQELDMGALNDIERELAENAERQSQAQVAGTYDDVAGVEDMNL